MRWKRWLGWKKRNWLYKTALLMLVTVILAGLLADFLANNKPILAEENGQWKTPAIKEILVDYGWSQWSPAERNRNWKSVEYEWAIWPPIPFLPSDQDRRYIDAAPLSGNHLLGTDRVGRDLLAAMVHAIRIDLTIGIFAILLAGLIGILLGGLAGFYGDDTLLVSRGQLLLIILFLPLAIFYGWMIWLPQLSTKMETGFFQLMPLLLLCCLIFIGWLALALLLGVFLNRIKWFSKKISLPLDIGISRLIEVVVSIPVIYLLIMLVGATSGNSLIWIILAIGLTRWTGIARFTRAEMLKIRELDYTTSGRALGFNRWRLLFRHAAPNALPPALIAMAFGIANAILLESFLAFIGLGIPPDIPTWGSLLNEGRQDPSAWWMALFPGIAIFITVFVFNVIGDHLNDQMSGKKAVRKN